MVTPQLAPPPQLKAYEFKLGSRRFVLFEWDVAQGPVEPPAVELTAAERVVFQLILDGKSTREIASTRGCAERTVANQIASVFQKFNVHSRCELVARFANVEEASSA
jgi:DNA-binding CsgD family transcriptional regulator